MSINIDGFVKSPEEPIFVIPVETGIQSRRRPKAGLISYE